MNKSLWGSYRSGCLAVLFVLLASGLSTSMAQKPGAVPAAKFTEQGTERCLECHAGENMTLIADSPHGNTDNPHTPYAQRGCESCHGKGSLHVSRARGGSGFPALIQFKRRGSSVEVQNEACLNCHEFDMGELEGMQWTGSLHDTGRMTCGSCHSIHSTENVVASREGQKQNCSRCHEEQINNHPKFDSKGINFDALSCSQCHDVHQLERRPEG
ncbi:MAG: cytochrome c3 family protein [Gammaproteobacteria bacterium]